jgi:LssY-like putative type I secretion system component LssY
MERRDARPVKQHGGPIDADTRRWALAVGVALLLALGVAGAIEFATHVVGPRLLTHYDGFPALANAPKRSVDARGHAADPVNVALVGEQSDIESAMRRAGWTAAQPITRRSSIGIAASVLLHRPDSAAPVSPLYLYGRAQDLAFEREVGPSASRRHHVRLWRADSLAYGGHAVWIGGATFDLRAGVSHRGLHPTHHIAPDVDEERDTLVADLVRARQVRATFRVTGLGLRVNAHNADGDRFDTDGELRVVVLSRGNAPTDPAPEPALPVLVRLKDHLWAWFHRH